MCTDYRSNDASEITMASSDCTGGSTDYQWSTGECDRAGIVGGCFTLWHKNMTGADLQEIQWYYPDGPFKTAGDLEAHCTALGSLFVGASFSFPPLPQHG
jgi:hypothetical protein